jgi:hypothetical protein
VRSPTPGDRWRASTYSPRRERIASFTGGEANCEFAPEQSTWSAQRSIAAQTGNLEARSPREALGGPYAGRSRVVDRQPFFLTQIPRSDGRVAGSGLVNAYR